MKLEKKTEAELYDYIVHFKSGEFNGDSNKQWISVESLIERLDKIENLHYIDTTFIALRQLIEELKHLNKEV
jgi:hypothetical protein